MSNNCLTNLDATVVELSELGRKNKSSYVIFLLTFRKRFTKLKYFKLSYSDILHLDEK